MGVCGQRHAPAALPPGKTWYPLCWRFGGPHSRSGQVRKISPLKGFDPQTVQRVASCIPTELSRLLVHNIFLGNSLSSIRTTWLAHLRLPESTRPPQATGKHYFNYIWNEGNLAEFNPTKRTS